MQIAGVGPIVARRGRLQGLAFGFTLKKEGARGKPRHAGAEAAEVGAVGIAWRKSAAEEEEGKCPLSRGDAGGATAPAVDPAGLVKLFLLNRAK